MKNFEDMDTVEYDKILNDISKEIFSDDKELDNERVRIMLWAVVNLLLNKEIFSKQEYEDSVNEATMFFKLLKRRHNLQKSEENQEN